MAKDSQDFADDSRTDFPDGNSLQDEWGDTDAFRVAQKLGTTSGALVEFDGINGAPLIVGGDQVRQDAGVPNETSESGRITSLPVNFSSISQERLRELGASANGLIEHYYTQPQPNGRPDRALSFTDFSNMMKDIAEMDNLSEVEKCRLWSEIRVQVQKRGLNITDNDEIPEMIDSWKGRSDPYHALITLDDGYHANRLINMTPEEASKAIFEHEDHKEASGVKWWLARHILGINQGDVNASEGQLRALRALRDQGTFSAYAEEWTRQFVKPLRTK